VGLSRSVLRYEAIRSEETQVLQARIIDIAHERRRFGYRRIQMMLRREGVVVNHKRTYRLYREAGPAVRKRKKPPGHCGAPHTLGSAPGSHEISHHKPLARTLLATLALITFFPALTLWIPRLAVG